MTDAERLAFVELLLAQGTPLEQATILWLVEMARRNIHATLKSDTYPDTLAQPAVPPR